MVAHSQYHYGMDEGLFIEDQPLYRGNVVWDAWTCKDGLKLPVDNYSKNAFGDTHSLVLIIDSLSVQNALLNLLPETQRDTPAAKEALQTILKAASCHVAELDTGERDQGQAEGDVLENVLNALADLILGPRKGERLEGNTWWNETDRAAFYNLIDKITDEKTAYGQLAGKLELIPASEIDPVLARTDFGTFAALWTLSPFVFKGIGEFPMATTSLFTANDGTWRRAA
jgi:hypothetical protein